jgi:hypothetical protein
MRRAGQRSAPPLNCDVRPHTMTLGELIPAIQKASSDRVVHGLVDLLQQWRTSADTADDLYQNVERYIGNSWIASDAEHKTIYSLWSAFRAQCIAGRGGMTINERLYCFDLFDAWDNAKTEDERAVVRHKIDFVASNE